MKIPSYLRSISLMLIAVMIIPILTGCKPVSGATGTADAGMPAEITAKEGAVPNANDGSRSYSEEPPHADFIDNNRANIANKGLFAEDAQNIYYRNIQDDNALYKFDKTTGVKTKLTDTNNGNKRSQPPIYYLDYINVTDDKVYFINLGTGNNFRSLYSVNKDGTGRTEVISGFVHECIVNGGYIYYTGGVRDDPKNPGLGLFKYNIETKAKTMLTENAANMIMNTAGDKLYYVKYQNETSLYEYDLINGEERLLLTDKTMSETKVASVNISNINYFDGAIYYIETTIKTLAFAIKKYDLASNTVEPVFEKNLNTSLKYIYTLAVSHLGLYFISSTGDGTYTLFNGNSLEPVRVADFEMKEGNLDLAIAGENIYVMKTSFVNENFIKTWDVKGNEVSVL